MVEVVGLDVVRLVTSAGGWVRNGDRWQVLARRPDDSLVLASLDSRGKVTVPVRYVKDNLALAYAVTVHRGQGVTTDRAVLLVDSATAAEHLYVGLTRGRGHNLACVVCEPLDDGHSRRSAPSAHDVLAAALCRTGNELSATEAARAGLASLGQPGTVEGCLLDYEGAAEYLCTTPRHVRKLWETRQLDGD